ncbi:hypothetical protein QTP88_026480 [Uroleucon formosanum]
MFGIISKKKLSLGYLDTINLPAVIVLLIKYSINYVIKIKKYRLNLNKISNYDNPVPRWKPSDTHVSLCAPLLAVLTLRVLRNSAYEFSLSATAARRSR